MRSERIYEVTFTIPSDPNGFAFLFDLVESNILNTRDNEEGKVVSINDLSIRIIERIVK